MEVYCTRSGCPRPQNYCADLDDAATLKTVQQKYCTACGMPLILKERYLPLKLLGRGGFGAAFLAIDRDTPRMRRCVVKQFKPSGNLTQSQLAIAQKLFEREAEFLEDLGSQHNQIPDLFAFFELTVRGMETGQDKFFYLVQEFIDGKSLEEELAENGRFSEAQVSEVLQQILPLLQFVHEHGSIHRDIKPSNIMRHRNGKLFLLDFGAVKQVTAAAATASTGIYSMGFAPPEQMAGGQVYPSTDLYALAVTAIILLTDQEAAELFDGYSNQWNWRQQATVSSRLADVLDRMLLPAPNQRFQSAEEVMAALCATQTAAPPTPRNSPPQALPSTPPITPKQAPAQTQLPLATRSSQPAFSTLELLFGAGFSGFEGGLIAISLYSLLPSPVMTLGASVLILSFLIFAQFRRWIGRWDLLIIAGISLVIIWFAPIFIPVFQVPPSQVVLLATAAGLAAIACTALFRLIYKLLSLML